MNANTHPAYLLNVTHRNAMKWHRTQIKLAILTGDWLYLPWMIQACRRDRRGIIRQMREAWADYARRELAVLGSSRLIAAIRFY